MVATPEVLSLAFQGTVLAVLIRWLLAADIDLLWALCVGTVSRLCSPWLLQQTPQRLPHAWSDTAISAAVILVVLGVADVSRHLR